MREAINDGYGVGVRQRVPCGGKGLATPILDQVQEMPNEDEEIIIATGKWSGHADAVEESEQVA